MGAKRHQEETVHASATGTADHGTDHFAVPVSNRRCHARRPLPESAAYLSGHRILIARVGDLSVSGAFLHTQYPDPVGTRATLDLDIDGQRACLDVEVVRVSFDRGVDGVRCGMAVSFLAVPVAFRRALLQRAPTASSRG